MARRCPSAAWVLGTRLPPPQMHTLELPPTTGAHVGQQNRECAPSLARGGGEDLLEPPPLAPPPPAPVARAPELDAPSPRPPPSPVAATPPPAGPLA